jgi:hypothetical protein
MANKLFFRMGLAGLLLYAMSATGCGRLVGKMEYLETSMSPGLHAPLERPVLVMHEQTAPRDNFQIILPPLAEVDWERGHDVARLQREQVVYVSDVNRQIDQLRRELILITALAHQQGAAGVAAVDPKIRTFRTSVTLINRHVRDFYEAEVDEWPALRARIDTELRQARHAVREAAEAVHKVRDPGYLLTSGPGDWHF